MNEVSPEFPYPDAICREESARRAYAPPVVRRPRSC